MDYSKACELISISNASNYSGNLKYAQGLQSVRVHTAPLRYDVAAKVVIEECEKRLSELLICKLDEVQKEADTFTDGLNVATQFVEAHGGKVVKASDGDPGYIFLLGSTSASVFQPYEDIDRFYYEA